MFAESLYRTSFALVGAEETPKSSLVALWEDLERLRVALTALVDAEVEQVKSVCLRFLQEVILTCSRPPKRGYRLAEPLKSDKYTIANVRSRRKVIRAKEIEARADATVAMLAARLSFVAADDDAARDAAVATTKGAGVKHPKPAPLSGGAFSACLTVLKTVATHRPQFMDRVAPAMVAAAKLAKSRGNLSATMALKVPMIALLRLKSSRKYADGLESALKLLGAGEQARKARALSAPSAARGTGGAGAASSTARSAPKRRSGVDPRLRAAGSLPTTALAHRYAAPLVASIVKSVTPASLAEMVMDNLQYLPPPPPRLEASAAATREAFRGTVGTARPGRHVVRLLAVSGGASEGGAADGGQVALKKLAERELELPSPDDAAATAESAFLRVLSAEAGARATGRWKLWCGLVSRLACEPSILPPVGEERRASDDGARKRRQDAVVEYVLGGYRERHAMALALLFQEYRRAISKGDDDASEPVESGRGPSKRARDVDSDDDGASASQRRRLDSGSGKASAPAGDANSDSAKFSAYDSLLTSLVEGLRVVLDPRDRLFTQLLLDAPRLPPAVLRVVEVVCLDPARWRLGLVTLRDLIQSRPESRHSAVHTLLRAGACAVDVTRQNAIRLIRKRFQAGFPNASLDDAVRTFAVRLLHSAAIEMVARPEAAADGNGKDAAPAAKADDAGGEAGEPAADSSMGVTSADEPDIPLTDDPDTEVADTAPVSTTDVKRRLELCLALCTCEPALLSEVFACYAKAPTAARQAIHEEIPLLIKSLGLQRGAAFVLSNVVLTSDAIPLAMQSISILVDESDINFNAEDMAAVRALYASPGGARDIRLLLPVLAWLPKQELGSHLPQIVSAPKALLQHSLARLWNAAHAGTSLTTPVDFLVGVLALSRSDAPLEQILSVAQTCLWDPTFGQAALQAVLDQLSARSPLPLLVAWAMEQTLERFDGSKPFIVELMARLVDRQVYRHKHPWQGFIRLVERTAPDSFAVLVQLPPAELRNLLRGRSDDVLRSTLHSWANAESRRHSVPRAVLEALEPDQSAKAAPTAPVPASGTGSAGSAGGSTAAAAGGAGDGAAAAGTSENAATDAVVDG